MAYREAAPGETRRSLIVWTAPATPWVAMILVVATAFAIGFVRSYAVDGSTFGLLLAMSVGFLALVGAAMLMVLAPRTLTADRQAGTLVLERRVLGRAWGRRVWAGDQIAEIDVEEGVSDDVPIWLMRVVRSRDVSDLVAGYRSREKANQQAVRARDLLAWLRYEHDEPPAV